MGPLKYPGLDEFRTGIYQTQWQTIGRNFSNAVLSLLNSEGMNSSLNFTFIVFIPKKQVVDSVNDFRLLICAMLFINWL